MNIDEGQEEQVTYLATVSIRFSASGCVVDVYPDELHAVLGGYDPRPKYKVLGAFATPEMALTAVIKRVERYAAGVRGWRTRRQNQQNKAV